MQIKQIQRNYLKIKMQKIITLTIHLCINKIKIHFKICKQIFKKKKKKSDRFLNKNKYFITWDTKL
jgi:hypothetical protein